jgi:putative FmdB family regulatory protein
MPIYEYECPECGEPFEKRVPMAEADKTTCPACGSPNPKRKLSKIVVKGQQVASSAAVPASGGT